MSDTETIANSFNTYVMPTYTPKIALVRGKGTKVWDADGKVYLDFITGISVLNVGHCHPKVVAAIQQQLEVLGHVSNLFYTENEAKLAEKLSILSLNGKCFFCNSGAEANEGLIKLARKWGHETGRYEIICMKNSFHGRTLATAAATGQEKVKQGFDPMPEGFKHADFNDIESIKALITDKTVAILLEAVQGEGGVVPATAQFMKDVRELCNEKDLLMLCDEVQCGMGRTGHWFGFQAYGVKPDAFSLAKALGSGYAVGAVVGGPKLADVFQPGNHASTFGGSPLACVAALATLEVLYEEGLVARASRSGEKLRKGLDALVEKYEHAVEVRGAGLMLGLVMDQAVKPLVEKMTDWGLLTIATADTVVRMLPPLNVKDDEIEEALEIMDDCLAEWHEELAPPAETTAEEPAAVEEPPAETPEEPVAEAPADATSEEETKTQE